MAPRIIIDFPHGSGQPARRLFHAPQRIITARHCSEVLPALEAIQRDTEAGATAVGFISYEAAPAFDDAFKTRAPNSVPLLWFAVFEQEQAATFEMRVSDHSRAWQSDTPRPAYASAVQRIHDEIAAGTTYQVNYTVRMHAPFSGDPLAAYESLRHAQGVGYHAYIETDDWCVLSLSPELFFESNGLRIHTRPMKGTRPRGRYGEEDEALTEELRGSEKERAENLMIVDLMRNDIGRVAQPGSVQVTRLYDVERYPTVLQMTSTVEATLRPETTLAEVMSALFPPGSVTGAPKISTMALIAELEQAPRGVYCGALGIVERNSWVFNVPIRTIWLDRHAGSAEYGTGSGITADSRTGDEFGELITKTAVVAQPWPHFDLLETMRAESGAIIRLDGHLQRLAESAEYFGFHYCEVNIRDRLREQLPAITGAARIRLLLSADGETQVQVEQLESLPEVRRVACARQPVDARDRFLCHKTTRRAVYEKQAQAAPDMFDVLLFNERDEITEFTRANVVLELGGERFTPARSCGLLAGVFRGELLAQGVIKERVIHRTEVTSAQRIWWINSVREWVDVELA
ncbi:MAG TPA: aminodeoxychorismate synthase component I [Longimicrobiales bacterium]|nr:aminodeoxychorismate synthase component I [Longimicrobiales bacterium]